MLVGSFLLPGYIYTEKFGGREYQMLKKSGLAALTQDAKESILSIQVNAALSGHDLALKPLSNIHE